MKDKIFDNIFSQFTLGQKLQRYDEYRELEALTKKITQQSLEKA